MIQTRPRCVFCGGPTRRHCPLLENHPPPRCVWWVCARVKACGFGDGRRSTRYLPNES